MTTTSAPVGSAIQPCPFCGGEPEWIKGKDKVHPYRGICKSCGAGTAHHGDFRACIAAWNTRVQVEQSSRLREGGEPVRPADVGFLKTLTDQEIEKHGRMFSSMVRAGLLQNILAELYDHRAYRNAALANSPLAPVGDRASRYHFTDISPFTVSMEEGDVQLGTGWLAITEAEYSRLRNVSAPVGDVREALEAVAADLRLNEQGGFITTDLHETTIAKVRAALQSSPSSHVPPGYVLMPRGEIETLAFALRLEGRVSLKYWGGKLQSFLSATPALQTGEE